MAIIKRILLQEDNNRPKIIRFTILALTIFFTLLCIEIWVVNRLSTYGDKIYQLTQVQASLELENQVLMNTIAASSSMVVLERKATLLGFNSINQIEYIRFSDKLASAK